MSENTFTTAAWDEKIVAGAEDTNRVAHVHSKNKYAGLIEGEGTSDYLLYYPGAGYDGKGITSSGLEWIEGSVDGREGAFVVRHEVGFDTEGVHGTWTVVDGSGTGELAGISGSGTISSTFGEPSSAYTFDYQL
ncbi:DUF3224 domain-containing protein [Amycolatopsis nigrescens]|uniref:DUF3224 domain-containing protein n=1 Tax=Amycolatopsis nigrescens TaxID=381445 RepID=UPI00035DE10B|nr:DUF3224 domain-containing protein [Amycolatopsis nigrescens]